jgi:hypothetical protein
MTMLVTMDQDAVVLGGCDRSVLDEIARASISLAVWWREPPVALSLADAISFEPVRVACHVSTVAMSFRAALAITGSASWHYAIANDAQDLARRFAEIMKVDEVRIRLEPISTNACWKFHADYVAARLITTYFGPGTQWVRAADPEPKLVHQLKTGNVGIFKGKLADPEVRVLHRSPPVGDTGDHRIMLVIDPAMSPQV